MHSSLEQFYVHARTLNFYSSISSFILISSVPLFHFPSLVFHISEYFSHSRFSPLLLLALFEFNLDSAQIMFI